MNPSAQCDNPPLYQDRGFWGMTITQFLGAFNDNLFKQLMLLLALKVAADGDLQGVAMMVFAAPFILFSGLAGFLSDRFRKWPIIFSSKLGELAVMVLGMVGFLWFASFGFTGLLIVLFLMGTQSAFFGPGKYGILPEMLREKDLPAANGAILMTTFLAIIFGTAAAGLLIDPFVTPTSTIGDVAPYLWRGSLVCISIAVVGIGTCLMIRNPGPASPGMKFSPWALAVTPETFHMLRGDCSLVSALLATCAFWLVAGLTQQTVNSLGTQQLEVSDGATSALVAMIGVGIAIGALAAGKISRGRADFRLLRWGAWGCVLMLLTLSLPGGEHGQLLGFIGSLIVLVLLGVMAAFFAIPLQVFVQSRPPKNQKGRVIAVQNQLNFVAILASGAIYTLFDGIVQTLGWQRAPIFAFTAALMLPVALFYRPAAAPSQYSGRTSE